METDPLEHALSTRLSPRAHCTGREYTSDQSIRFFLYSQPIPISVQTIRKHETHGQYSIPGDTARHLPTSPKPIIKQSTHLRLTSNLFLSPKKRSAITQLSKQLLLKGLHVDVALDLRARGPQLEADDAGLDALVELLQAADAGVLHRVLEAGGQVGDELADRSVLTVSNR